MIFFDEPTHTYRLDDPVNGVLCVSVTTLIDLFKNKFDSEYWSLYHGIRKALGREKTGYYKYLAIKFGLDFEKEFKKPREEWFWTLAIIQKHHALSDEEVQFGVQQILHEWKIENDVSKVKGTKFHNYKEGEAYTDSGIQYQGVHIRLGDQVEDLSNLHSPNGPVYIPELKIYNRKYRISGTADKNYFFPDKKLDIDDWKTNKKIDQKGFFGQKMKYSLKHLDDCNYNHYCIQVSTYAWMLEQYGYKPNNLKFTHVKLAEDGLTVLEATEYHTNYMKKEVELMLEYFDQHRDELLMERQK